MTRIRRLLYPKGSSGAWAPFFAAVTFIVTTAIALAAWQSEPSQQGAAGQPQTDRAKPSPYVLWLDEDVVYIIADEERAAFQRLTTDEERGKFIEQFWLRRDPTPGTAKNEFKEEHYRRIAYANERFAARDKEGWKTDRGRIYIQRGPPDEIEAHPSGGVNTPPFEIWSYRHVEAGDNLSIQFRDRSRTGDYELAPGNAR